jgi:HSP20 family protein
MLRSLWLAGAFNYPQNTTANANVYEFKDKYMISIEASEFEENEIDIELVDNILSISGSKESQLPEGFTNDKPQQRKLHHRFHFRQPINGEQIEASLTDGLLTINLKKTPKTRIPIQAA